MKIAKLLQMPARGQPPRALEEEIRCRAYQLYEERGKIEGRELEDWLQAEKEIMTHQVRRKTS